MLPLIELVFDPVDGVLPLIELVFDPVDDVLLLIELVFDPVGDEPVFLPLMDSFLVLFDEVEPLLPLAVPEVEDDLVDWVLLVEVDLLPFEYELPETPLD